MLAAGTSTAADIAASVAAAATVGLFIAAWAGGRTANKQLRELRDQRQDQLIAEGRRRVYAHLARLFDSDFVKMTAEAQRLFKASKTLDDTALKELWVPKRDEEKARILAVMNFYEIFAGEYNDADGNLIDKATADKAISILADRMWMQAEPFIGWFRTHFGTPLAFADWQQLHHSLSETEPADPRSPGTGVRATLNPHTATTSVAKPATTARADTVLPPGGGGTPSNECPPDPCTYVPASVLIVAAIWTAAIVAAFFTYVEIDAVEDFFPAKIGELPFSAIWFGAAGGLLVSLEGIFKYNRRWLRSYDYWHYARPVLGALMGALGCLVFIVLTAAAASKQPAPADAAFYAVVALALGYREASFRALLARLVDTVIVPSEKKEGASQ
jgi:hypothetical protein